MLELAVIENDEAKAKRNLQKALTCSIERDWMFDTTINNLKLLHRFRGKRNEDLGITGKMIGYLEGQKKGEG